MAFFKKISLSTIAIFIIALTCFVIDLSLKNWEKRDRVIEHDIHWYYAYLPSTFIYDDIKEEKSSYQFADDYYLFWPTITADGKKVTKTTCGLAIMYAPFFFVAHAYACLTDYPENGFSEPYKVFLLLSAIFYLIVGLDFLRKVLRHFSFTERQIAITLLLIGLGTNLLCYASQSAPMSHVYNFCLFAIFIHYTIKWYNSYSIKNTIIIGLLLGLISLIRPSNALIIIFFAFYNVYDFASFKERLAFFRRECFLLNLIAFFAFIVWIPQFLYWKEVTGSYLFYSYTDEGFFFTHPRIMEGLFSFRKGWLIYTPMMAIALIGLFFRKDAIKGLRFPIALFTILNIYIIFSWWCWWYGGTFGQRSLIESYALLAIPFALVVKAIEEKKILIKLIFTTICLFFIWLNLFQTYQYENLSLHWEGMTKELYFKQFGKMEKIPDYDKYLSLPNFAAAKKGEDCETEFSNGNTVNASTGSERIISIKAPNGKFLCADESKNLWVFADKDVAQSWETFKLISLGNDVYCIKSHQDLFFSVELHDKNELVANRKEIGEWEKFTLVKLEGNFVAFKASNDKYLTFDKVTQQLFSNSSMVGENERFEIIEK